MPEANTTPFPAPESGSVTVIKSVMDTAVANRKLIDAKKTKLSTAIKATIAAVPVIQNEKQDKYFNDLIVLAKNGHAEISKLRKEYTAKVRTWLEAEIAPENELAVEIGSLVAARNARAKLLADQANEKQAAINKQRERELYEIELKKELKLSVEKGLFDKAIAFEAGIDEAFKKITIANYAQVKKMLEAVSPKLKEDFFNGLFMIDFNPEKMTQDEFDALVKRAKTYWIFERCNEAYITTAKEILKKWIDKLPQRLKELEIIAKGGDQGERVKKIVEERTKAEEDERKKNSQAQVQNIEKTASLESAGDAASAEFRAQAQTQKIEKPSGTRQEKYFVLDNPGDIRQLANIIGAIIIHMIPEKKGEDLIKMVVQHNGDGTVRKDKDGVIEYTPGVQFWLDTATTLGYTPNIPGITQKFKVSTVARKDK